MSPSLISGGTGYSPGDVIAFDATGTAFSQELGIAVDSVIGTTGPIANWHFVWGGQYSSVPGTTSGGNFSATPLPEDSTNSYSASGGSGAQLAPIWSGWTVMSNSAYAAGNNYSVGDLITFAGTGQITNQNQNVQIVVDSVSGGTTGPIATYHFANFGSYKTLPSILTMSGSGGTGSGASITPNWSGGTLATTISSAVSAGGTTTITPTDPSPLPSIYMEPVQFWYYGHDDGYAINKALNSSSSGADVILPGNCGTTQQINLTQDTSAQAQNPALRGLSTSSSGIYAFGSPAITAITAITAMNHVIYQGAKGSVGGGLKDLVVEGLGIPQGTGHGYNPTMYPMTPSQNGTVVEIDGGERMHFDNVWLRDGFGSGNSIFSCTPSDADPQNAYYNHNPGDIWMLNSRMEVQQSLAGAYSPDYALDAYGCHDSYFTNPNAFTGTVANIRTQQNHFLSAHVFSYGYPNFPSNPTSTQTQQVYPGYPTVLGFPGVATYGIWVDGHAWITDTQCDVASVACIKQEANATGAPTNIFGLKMDCGPGSGAPIGYYGVEFAAGASYTNVMGVGAKQSCGIPSSQLIGFDTLPPDPTLQVFGNSTYSLFAQLALPAFTQPQGRLSLSSTQSVMTADVNASTKIYYLPYVGQQLPVWNGLMFVPVAIGTGVTLNLDSNSSDTGYQAAGNLYDVYAGLKPGGSLVLCTGPAWSSTTSRGPGSTIQNFEGVWVSAAAGMTCRHGNATGDTIVCAPKYCTYLGTMYATADGTTAMQFGPNSAVGGPCGSTGIGNVLALWNAWNRVHAFSVARDVKPTWTQNTVSTWETADPLSSGGLCNRITFVDGLQQSPINTVETQQIQSGTASKPTIGAVIDSVIAAPLSPAQQANIVIGSVAYSNWSAPLLGLHYAQAMEFAFSSSTASYQNGLSLQLNWEY